MLCFLYLTFYYHAYFRSFGQAHFIVLRIVTFHPGSDFCFQFPQSVRLLLHSVILFMQHIIF